MRESWIYNSTRRLLGHRDGFLHHITEKWAKRQLYMAWDTPVAEEILRMVGMQSASNYVKLASNYIGSRKATVV